MTIYAFRCLLLMLCCSLAAHVALAQTATKLRTKTKVRPAVTTVYLVRHAEKDTVAHPADPALTSVGQARAQELSRLLVQRHPAALFTTDTRRTRATLAPLAAATGLQPEVYDARQLAALARRISQDYAGKAVVVVGHSNTLLPLIEALGATSPVDKIGDEEYDYLFTVRLAAGNPPTVGVRGYGPERKLPTAAKAQRRAAKAAPAAPVN